MNLIEELYYGNICPNGQGFDQTPGYAEAMAAIAANEEILTKSLSGQEKKQFFDLVNAFDEVLAITAVQGFANGFRIGARFVLDTFVVEPDRILKESI